MLPRLRCHVCEKMGDVVGNGSTALNATGLNATGLNATAPALTVQDLLEFNTTYIAVSRQKSMLTVPILRPGDLSDLSWVYRGSCRKLRMRSSRDSHLRTLC